MATKYDYKLHVINIDEAMEILGYTSKEKFLDDADMFAIEYLHGENPMFSYSEITNIAYNTKKVFVMPEEIRKRFFVKNVSVKKEQPCSVDTVERNMKHPYMSNHKCTEKCASNASGFCLNGDMCFKYGVSNVTKEPIPELSSGDKKKSEPVKTVAKANDAPKPVENKSVASPSAIPNMNKPYVNVTVASIGNDARKSNIADAMITLMSEIMNADPNSKEFDSLQKKYNLMSSLADKAMAIIG